MRVAITWDLADKGRPELAREAFAVIRAVAAAAAKACIDTSDAEGIVLDVEPLEMPGLERDQAIENLVEWVKRAAEDTNYVDVVVYSDDGRILYEKRRMPYR